MKPGGSEAEVHLLEPNAKPFWSQGTVNWSVRSGTVRIAGEAKRQIVRRSVSSGTKPASQNDAADWVEQAEFLLGLPGGRHMVLENRTEKIRLYNSDGVLTGTAKAQMTAAFASIGKQSPEVDLTLVNSGRTRIGCAATSPSGALLVCLSETLIKGPLFIAAFDPDSGGFIRMFAAERPAVPERRIKDDPEGLFVPTRGKMTDELVVGDMAGILAIYRIGGI